MIRPLLITSIFILTACTTRNYDCDISQAAYFYSRPNNAVYAFNMEKMLFMHKTSLNHPRDFNLDIIKDKKRLIGVSRKSLISSVILSFDINSCKISELVVVENRFLTETSVCSQLNTSYHFSKKKDSNDPYWYLVGVNLTSKSIVAEIKIETAFSVEDSVYINPQFLKVSTDGHWAVFIESNSYGLEKESIFVVDLINSKIEKYKSSKRFLSAPIYASDFSACYLYSFEDRQLLKFDLATKQLVLSHVFPGKAMDGLIIRAIPNSKTIAAFYQNAENYVIEKLDEHGEVIDTMKISSPHLTTLSDLNEDTTLCIVASPPNFNWLTIDKSQYSEMQFVFFNLHRWSIEKIAKISCPNEVFMSDNFYLMNSKRD